MLSQSGIGTAGVFVPCRNVSKIWAAQREIQHGTYEEEGGQKDCWYTCDVNGDVDLCLGVSKREARQAVPPLMC